MNYSEGVIHVILDLRCRPPFGDFLKQAMFDQTADFKFATLKIADKFGCEVAESYLAGSMDMFFHEMNRAGVTKGIVPFRKLKNGDNSTLLELMNQYPGIFFGVPNIDPLDVNAVNEIQTYVKERACVGIIMEHGLRQEPLYVDDSRSYEIYEYCEKESIPVIFTFGSLTVPSLDYMNPMRLAHVADMFPHMKMIIAHGGWPYVSEMVYLAFKYDNLYLSPDMYALHTAGHQTYFDAANYMLQDKILYGSAYPTVDMIHSVEFYLSKLNDAVKDKIMYENAAKLFGLMK